MLQVNTLGFVMLVRTSWGRSELGHEGVAILLGVGNGNYFVFVYFDTVGEHGGQLTKAMEC